jgi:alanyl-tRNA synthetase
LILDRSSFCAKAGGQEADLGTIAFEGGGKLVVSNVQTYGGYALSSGVVFDRGVCPKPWKAPNSRIGLPS